MVRQKCSGIRRSYLGVRVYAPDQYDWYYSNGKVEPWGGFYDANNQLQMDTNQPGHEFTFKRRKP